MGLNCRVTAVKPELSCVSFAQSNGVLSSIFQLFVFPVLSCHDSRYTKQWSCMLHPLFTAELLVTPHLRPASSCQNSRTRSVRIFYHITNVLSNTVDYKTFPFLFLRTSPARPSPWQDVESFVREVALGFMPSFLPIAERRGRLPFTEQQRSWQLMRRGRYLEFNLLYDRGKWCSNCANIFRVRA